MLRRALEGAGFISAYDRSEHPPTLGVPPPEKLDETAAREIAVKQGLGVVLAGSIEPRGSGYEISVKAIQTVTGNDDHHGTGPSVEQGPGLGRGDQAGGRGAQGARRRDVGIGAAVRA